MRIYLSGPMTGYPESNYPAFNDAARALRAAGYTVHNPAEFPHDGPPETFPLRKAFAAYCKFICEEADAVVVLPKWERSKGATCEVALARNCGLPVLEYHKDLMLRVQHPEDWLSTVKLASDAVERDDARRAGRFGVPTDDWGVPLNVA